MPVNKSLMRKRMRMLRGDRSQRDIARQSKGKISDAAICQMETGVVSNPTLDMLCIMAKLYGVSIGYLIGEV